MYIHIDTLLFAVVFQNFRNICLEIYEFDPAKKFSAPGFSWKAALKNVTRASIKQFEWIKDTSQFNEDFMKYYNEENDERYFLEVDVQCL